VLRHSLSVAPVLKASFGQDADTAGVVRVGLTVKRCRPRWLRTYPSTAIVAAVPVATVSVTSVSECKRSERR
jgi:hypothetical protein